MSKLKDLSPLMEAAQAFDEQLSRFEDATETLKRSPMSSAKHLERAAVTLKEVGSIDEKLGEHVRALVEQINRVKERQQQQAEVVLQVAQQLQQRTADFQGLQEKYSALGKVAADLNGSLTSAFDQSGGAPAPELRAALTKVGDRLAQAAEEAQRLETEANDKDFSDMARLADSLRQQVLSTKNRLGLLADKLRQTVN